MSHVTSPKSIHRRPGRGPSGRRRRGAALLEFAIVMPVLLIVVLGMIEMGRAVMVVEVLSHAARIGARTAAISSGSSSTAVSAAKTALSDSGISGASVTVYVNNSSMTDAAAAASGDVIAVTVTVPYANVTWISNPQYLNGKNLSAKVVMRKE